MKMKVKNEQLAKEWRMRVDAKYEKSRQQLEEMKKEVHPPRNQPQPKPDTSLNNPYREQIRPQERNIGDYSEEMQLQLAIEESQRQNPNVDAMSYE